MSAPSSARPQLPVTPAGPEAPGDPETRVSPVPPVTRGSAEPDEPEDLGQLDLEDRHALRRVAGLSTELQDITEVEYRALRLERVVLMGVWTDGTLATAENSLRELSRLAETAGSQVLDGLIQRRGRPDPATYVGAGKAAELAEIVTGAGADTVICDGELSPSQLRRLEGVVRVKVIDRTALILDIFAQHARSKEGKAQVELAQLEYLLPRLRGWGESLSRQAGGRVAAGGGIGTRGPGETKIETDRRRIRTRTAKLRRELAGMATGREVKRGQRRRRAVPSVAIAGYTNAGKSTLLNALTGATAGVGDRLFQTLDPTTRVLRAGGRDYLLTDTVGFIRKLPHQLVEAFGATLEETRLADMILHVVDASVDEEELLEMTRAVEDVLHEIDAEEAPRLLVLGKADRVGPDRRAELENRHPRAVLVSSLTGEGLAELTERIEDEFARALQDVDLLIPFDEGARLAELHEIAGDLEREETPGGVRVMARLPPNVAARYERFTLEPHG
jgi:GTPase